MELILPRFAQGLGGTFGVVVHGSIPVVNTVELPWMGNKPGASCIPAQCYKVKRVKRPKHGVCFEVQDVPGRSNILFHTANTIHDIQGCIGVAMYFGELGQYPGLPALLNQPVGRGAGLKRFMDYLKGVNEFDLEIRNAWL